MRLHTLGALFGYALGTMCIVPALAQEILPFPPKPSGSTAGRTMQESIYSPLPPVKRLPEDAPNILIVLIDDVGPGQTDAYGGEIHTPTLSKIAGEGISYNRFHTTAMCSPTRAALLTGRNHHRIANGQITEFANDWDGFMGTVPKSSATVAEVLKDYGYSTAAWASGTTRPPNRPPPPVRSTTGRPDTVSSIFMGSLPAKRRNTNRCSCATRPMWSIPKPRAATITIT